jgi:hypothetical protein
MVTLDKIKFSIFKIIEAALFTIEGPDGIKL